MPCRLNGGFRLGLGDSSRPIEEMKTEVRVKKVQMPAQSALQEKGPEVTHRKLLGGTRRLLLVSCFLGA